MRVLSFWALYMFRYHLSTLLALAFFMFSSQAISDTATPEQLAKQPYWRALLHIPVGETRSEITDSQFFLAKDGATNPEAELIATLSQLALPVGDDSNAHAQCRFIARKHWLLQQLPKLVNDLPLVDCPLFNDWTDDQNISSVSAIFASGYLGNPASFYGHILLKFNSDEKQKTLLQQQSLNFGAAVPDEENPLLYIAKGLFGGYNAVFSHGVFYKNVLAYGEAELRDLWEYQLSLTSTEVEQLTFHAWELIGRDYQYFFIKENCAFRMAELLELVINAKLVNKQQPWAMPISVFHHLTDATHHGQPLVSNIILHPSRQQRFHQKYHDLNTNQLAAVQQIIDAGFDVNLPIYDELSITEKSGILEMLFDYIEFLRINEHPLFSEISKKQLLNARLALPPSTKPSEFTNTEPPHTGTLPSMLQLAVVNGNDDYAIRLRFRATYYDLLTVDTGRAPYSALSMFDLTAQINNNISIERFELLNIENMNVSKSGLPGDGGYAWKLNIGYMPLDLACNNCKVAQFSSGIGKAAVVSSNILVYGMADAHLHNNKLNSGLFSAQPRLGIISDIKPWWRMQLEFGRRYYLDGNADNFNWYQLQHRFGSMKDWDIRVNITKQRETEVAILTSFFW